MGSTANVTPVSAARRLRHTRSGFDYGDWHIHYDPPPIPSRDCDWHFYHDDFDGAEDGGDNRYGHARSLEECKQEIDRIEDEGA